MWLLFASLTAFFEACKDATGKQSLKTIDEYSVLFSFSAVGVLFMLPVLWLSGGIPTLGANFWWALLVGGSLNILAFTLYVRAIKIADLSLTVPLVTLTPLFLLVTSPLIVNEQPTPADAIGVILLVIGSYVLNITPSRGLSGVEAYGWAPLQSMARNPGSRLMLSVAFIWSITSNFDKVGVLNSSPLFWAVSLFTVIAGGMVPFVFWRPSSAGLKPLLVQWRLLGMTGGFNAIAITCQMFALTLAPVAQVIAVKRMSALLSVLFGHFCFGEKGLRSRLLGASIMVSGVVIMSLS
ncbi:MAG: EamA family transporter [Cyanobacteria bacterium P01_D01_bin.1]